MKKIKGNLIDLALAGEFDVIVHGCNQQNIMGSGIAKEIRERLPKAYEADTYWHMLPNGGKRHVHYSVADYKTFKVFNAYTQVEPGADASRLMIVDAFVQIRRNTSVLTRIGIPAIGCGIGGLEWFDIENLIDKIMEGYDITFVEYDGS